MISIPKATKQVIAQMPYIETLMAQNLVNISELARQIKPKVEDICKKDVSQVAVMMGLKRMVPEIKLDGEKVGNFINNIQDISVRSGLEEYTFTNSKNLIGIQRELFNTPGIENYFIAISRGITETTFILDKNLSIFVQNLTQKENLIYKTNHLSALVLKLPEKSTEIAGVYARILSLISFVGVSVVDAISTTNELTLILRDKDVDKAFIALKKPGLMSGIL